MCIRDRDLKLGTLLDDGNKQVYKEIVGSLIYLSTCTRWDIAYYVMQLTRAMSDPKDRNMVATKRVLRYLKGNAGSLCEVLERFYPSRIF